LSIVRSRREGGAAAALLFALADMVMISTRLRRARRISCLFFPSSFSFFFFPFHFPKRAQRKRLEEAVVYYSGETYKIKSGEKMEELPFKRVNVVSSWKLKTWKTRIYNLAKEQLSLLRNSLVRQC